MTSRKPISENIRQRIKEAKASNPDISISELSKKFGPHRKSVVRILSEDNPYVGISIEDISTTELKFDEPIGKPDDTSEVRGDDWTITLPKTRIHTLEELITYFEVDTLVWEVERFVCNKWEVGAKNKNDELVVEPLYQVKAFLKRRKEVEAIKKEIEELKDLAKSYSSEPFFVVRERSDSDLMLEINFPDAHLGKLAWGVETGHGNYDVKIAEQVYWEALETILDRADSELAYDHILYVVGNDLLNSDDIEGRTTSGTYVSSDARYHRTFAAVRNLMVKSIERLRQISKVKVMIVSGNHDQLSCWHMGDSLECYFHKYDDVEIDNLPRQRKYHEFGNVGLMFTHGHKGKRTDYPAIMAAEQPQMWGRTKYRECHTGHLHMTKTDEQHGFRTRILPSLTAPDDWLATNGFVGNLRNAEGYIWSKEEGLIGQVYYTVPE